MHIMTPSHSPHISQKEISTVPTCIIKVKYYHYANLQIQLLDSLTYMRFSAMNSPGGLRRKILRSTGNNLVCVSIEVQARGAPQSTGGPMHTLPVIV